MTKTRYLKHGVIVLAGVCTYAVGHAADWSDTWVGYQYSPSKREPGITTDIRKQTLELGYIGGDKYGTTLLVVDNLFSDDCYPAAPANPYANGCGGEGSLEVYGVLRRSLSLSAVSDRKVSFGPVRDVSLTAGLAYGTQNTLVATRPIKLTFGPTLSFDVKGGFLDVGLWVYKEKNHNGFYSPPLNSTISYKPTWNISMSWSVPITETVSFAGYGDIIGSKGKELFGQTSEQDSKREIHFFPKVMVDISRLSGLKPGIIKAGVGVEIWRHMYGAAGSVGTKSNAATFIVETHF